MASIKEVKAIKLLQDRNNAISNVHDDISNSLDDIKAKLRDIEGFEEIQNDREWAGIRDKYLLEMNATSELNQTNINDIFNEADSIYEGKIGLSDILQADDWINIDARLKMHLAEFNTKYKLDKLDYAIAGSCGLFAAMLDLLFVRAPLKPTVPWEQQVNGVFNKSVQKAFNKIFPPEKSKEWCDKFPIGAPDSSTSADVIGDYPKVLSPFNHRLRSLAHDPILGVIFGVWDMLHGTCTTIIDGKIVSVPSVKGSPQGSIFYQIGRMFGHLISDINAPTKNLNRGMGLPAPFMGFLRMLESIQVGDSTFGRQIEWMYLNGYDFRQFISTSIPMCIMEVLIRVLYVAKQVKVYNAGFGETIIDTMPFCINPRFRIMLAIAYGVSSSVNAGKMYITHNILNASYASWMGLVWNGFHALKWVLYERHIKLWESIERKEIEELESIVSNIDELTTRASSLPT